MNELQKAVGLPAPTAMIFRAAEQATKERGPESAKNAELLKLFYGADGTMKKRSNAAVARDLGLTPQAVSQRRARLMRRIRHILLTWAVVFGTRNNDTPEANKNKEN